MGAVAANHGDLLVARARYGIGSSSYRATCLLVEGWVRLDSRWAVPRSDGKEHLKGPPPPRPDQFLQNPI